VHGALAAASDLRGDYQALLVAREAEVVLARELGLAESEVAAESNVLYALIVLGRHHEALSRGTALLARVDAGNGDRDTSILWILEYVIHAQAELGLLDEAHGLVARLWRVLERWGESPSLWLPLMTLVAARRGRATESALLTGRLRHDAVVRNVNYSAPSLRTVEDAHAITVAALGKAEVERLIAAGAALNDDEIRAVALR